MPSPAVTYTFSNSTTADAGAVNQNFTDLVNSLSDGTKDLSISALTAAGNASFNGNVTLGNSSGDDITVTGSLASSIPIKTTNTYNIGSSSLGLASIYLGANSQTIRLIASASLPATVTATMPLASGNLAIDGAVQAKTTTYQALISDGYINCSGSAFTVTLYAASGNAGRLMTITKTDSTLANIITIEGNASETIDGALNTTLNTQYESVTMYCDGSNWFIHNRKIPQSITAYTPSMTSFGNGVGYLAWERRGSRIKIQGALIVGSSLPTSIIIFALPTGLVADYTAIPKGLTNADSYQMVGFAQCYTPENYRGNVTRNAASTVDFYITGASTFGGATGGWTNAVPITFAAGDAITVDLEVPIVGWKG